VPNRIIKESICTSDTLDQLSPEEERLFYRLLVQADDFGRFDGRPAVVLAACFPLKVHEITLDQVESWLHALADADLIRFYEVDGRRYLYFTTWDKHQQKRAKHSKYPDPPASDDDILSRDEHLISNDIKRESNDSKCPRESRIENRESRSGGNRAHARECDHANTAAATAAEMIHDDSVSPLTFYEQVVGTLCPATTLDVLDEYEHKGLHVSAIKWAIYEHRLSGGRGAKHLRSILQRLFDHGLLTAEDAESHERERRQRLMPSRASPQPEPLSWIDRELAKVEAEIRELEQRKAAGGEA